LYGDELIYERHRHRWEVNNRHRADLEAAGMRLSGVSPDGRLVEIVELPDHPFFIATQFHPEFKSRPDAPHPLFTGFVAAALEHSQTGDDGASGAESSAQLDGVSTTTVSER
jgi:CTP synthase